MNIGIIGLGRMGASIADRLIKAGHTVWGYDVLEQNMQTAATYGVHIEKSLEDLARNVRIFWLMVPQGKPVDLVIDQLRPHLKPRDIIVDGGNSFYKDSQRRAAALAPDIAFLDCGVSGGLQGHQLGYCLMVGGDKKIYDSLVPIFTAIAAPQAYAYIGASGAGHYVKMVHNGIEYGLLQAYAEGFQILKEGTFKEQLDLAQLSALWNKGSIIRSWLLQLSTEVFEHDQSFNDISGCIDQGGTGQWTVDEANAHKLSVPVLQESLAVRNWSCKTGGNYATKVVAMLRNKFGGHAVHRKDEA